MSTNDRTIQIEREANEIALDVHARAERLSVNPHYLIDVAKQHVTMPTRPLLDATSDNPLEASIARARAEHRFAIGTYVHHPHDSDESLGNPIVEQTRDELDRLTYVVRDAATGLDYTMRDDELVGPDEWPDFVAKRHEQQCTCVLSDDGDGESGPHLSIEHVVDCPQHGRDAQPELWTDVDEELDVEFGHALTSGRLEVLFGISGVAVRDNETHAYLADAYDDEPTALLAARKAFASVLASDDGLGMRCECGEREFGSAGFWTDDAQHVHCNACSAEIKQ